MNTLIRSTTVSLSRRSSGYEPLDHHHQQQQQQQQQQQHRQCQHQLGRRAFSKRNKESNRTAYSRSYRNERAKQRRIFLKSYKLEPVEKSQRRRRLTKPPPGLSKFAVKLTKAVVSVLSFLKIESRRWKSCDCRLAIDASSPTPKHSK